MNVRKAYLHKHKGKVNATSMTGNERNDTGGGVKLAQNFSSL